MPEPGSHIDSSTEQDVLNVSDLAEALSSLFHGDDALFTPDEIWETGVRYGVGLTGAERLYISGELDGRRVYQTLSRGKTGRYHLTTVELPPAAR